MPGLTVCELHIELKKKGIKGYSKLKKAELEALLASGKSNKKTKPAAAKPEPPKPPKLLKFHEEEKTDNLSTKSYIYLKRKVQKIKNMIGDTSTTSSEKANANRLLKKYEEAMNAAHKRQYSKKTKKK